MRFAFTGDQVAMRDAVAALLASECTAAHVRSAWEAGTGAVDGLWPRLAEMGVTGLTVPEGHGGLGLSEVDLVLVLEAAGWAGVPDPLVDTVAVGAPLLADVGGPVAETWLPRVAAGAATIGVSIGEMPYVLGADRAALLLLERDDELHVVEPAACTIEPVTSVDGARSLSTVDWHREDAAVVASGPDGWHEVNLAFDRGSLATAALLVGLARRMVAMTVEHVCAREQFGVAIGSFQAVKHHLANAHLAVEIAAPAVYRAAHSVAHGVADRARDVSMAKALASDAATGVARAALQCHGAIGYTTEYDLHLFLKRSWALAAAWGDAGWHRNRVGVAILDP